MYIVLSEGEVEYVSEDAELAEAYVYNQDCNARQEILKRWGIDDPTDKDIIEADFQAGIDGDSYEIVEVDISNKTEDDVIELLDGSEINVQIILKKLVEMEEEFEFDK